MIPSVRSAFNAGFTQEKYRNFLKDLDTHYPGVIDFRLAETPVFVPKDFTEKMLSACEHIIDVMLEPSFQELTAAAVPAAEQVPGAEKFPQMMCFDFGICRNANGILEPQLIEMQGFPTMYGFQAFFPEIMRRHFTIPDHFSHYFNGYTKDTYLAMLRQLILGNHAAENVILLEWKPFQQKTLIDFLCTRDYLGIEPVCLTELIAEGEQLFYAKAGKKIPVNRIYNRIIFDELNHQLKGEKVIDLTKPYNVEWVPHPNWFYRLSKYTLPFLRHPYIPETYFLNELKILPDDLAQFVLKPLFSFAGQGVVIDVTHDEIEKIDNPEAFILQRKVDYAAVIETPDEPAKAEIRVMYVWPEGAARPHAATNLTRLSKGKMIGVRYNKDREWVGGTVSFFEQ
ncbi:MAG: hypothetical protein KGP35_08595 [Bacteroidetes bacterium]|nr:hypothetical protein [Bacteroidota bacterium]